MITGVYETSKSGSVDVVKELIPEKYAGSYINAVMSEDGKRTNIFQGRRYFHDEDKRLSGKRVESVIL